MKDFRIIAGIFVYFLSICFTGCCERTGDSLITSVEDQPIIEPDYSGVTVPLNIATMNFLIKGEDKGIKLLIKSGNGTDTEIRLKDGIARFPAGIWRKLLSKNKCGKI